MTDQENHAINLQDTTGNENELENTSKVRYSCSIEVIYHLMHSVLVLTSAINDEEI